MAPGLLERLTAWFRPPPDDEYEVAEYVLSRSEPDPENRLMVYDDPVDSAAVADDGDFPPGVYLLQEVKPSGMAGDVVWEDTFGDYKA